MNGETIDRGLQQSKVIEQLRKEHKDKPEEIIRSIYIRSLSREPSAEEITVMLSELPEKKDNNSLKTYYKGVYWAVLNSSEFLFNH